MRAAKQAKKESTEKFVRQFNGFFVPPGERRTLLARAQKRVTQLRLPAAAGAIGAALPWCLQQSTQVLIRAKNALVSTLGSCVGVHAFSTFP